MRRDSYWRSSKCCSTRVQASECKLNASTILWIKSRKKKLIKSRNTIQWSIPEILSKSQQVMRPTAASAIVEPEKRALLLTGRNWTLCSFECEVDCYRKVLISSRPRDELRSVWSFALKCERIHSFESTVLAHENAIHLQRYKDGTSFEDDSNSFRLLAAPRK